VASLVTANDKAVSLAGGGPDAVALVVVGDELLLGELVDANGVWLAQRLTRDGLRVVSSTHVPDDDAAIAGAVHRALDAAPHVVVTGGLGPTSDDRTAAALATVPGVTRPMSNSVGSAPGIRVEETRGVVYALPGVPREMRAMVDQFVIADLLNRVDRLPAVRRRSLRVVGLTESQAAARLGPLEEQLRRDGGARIAYLATPGELEIRLTVRRNGDGTAAAVAVESYVSDAARALGTHLYGTDNDSLAEVVIRALVNGQATCATAESLTGGALGGALTDVPGSSAVYRGGVVAYATAVKEQLLDVPAAHLARHGAVDETTAVLMARGVQSRLSADYGVATTGVAGPDDQEGKPPGMVFVAMAGPAGSAFVNSLLLRGDRHTVRRQTVVYALDLVRRVVLALPVESAEPPSR
jgi:nicotinamide-nucleotide amidase